MKRSKVQMVRATVATAALLGLAACGSAQSEGSTKSTAPDPTLLRDGTMTVCTSDERKPFVFERGGKIVGFDVDLVGEVANELGVKVVLVTEDFDEIASGKPLNDNFCDVAIAAVSIDGDRARVVDFSSPYFNAKQVLVVQKGSGIKALNDVVGGRVAVQASSTGETYATDNRPLETQIVSFDEVGDLAAALSGSQVDAAVYDNNIVADAIKQNPNFEIVEEFDTGEQYGMLVKKDGNIDLLRVINDVLADMREDGRYDTIYQDWFAEAQS